MASDSSAMERMHPALRLAGSSVSRKQLYERNRAIDDSQARRDEASGPPRGVPGAPIRPVLTTTTSTPPVAFAAAKLSEGMLTASQIALVYGHSVMIRPEQLPNMLSRRGIGLENHDLQRR